MALMVSPLLVCTTVVALSGRITRARLQPSPAAASAEELCGLSFEFLDVSTAADDVEARLKIKQFLSVLPDGKIRSLPFLGLRQGGGRGGDQILQRSLAEP